MKNGAGASGASARLLSELLGVQLERLGHAHNVLGIHHDARAAAAAEAGWEEAEGGGSAGAWLSMLVVCFADALPLPARASSFTTLGTQWVGGWPRLCPLGIFTTLLNTSGFP